MNENPPKSTDTGTFKSQSSYDDRGVALPDDAGDRSGYGSGGSTSSGLVEGAERRELGEASPQIGHHFRALRSAGVPGTRVPGHDAEALIESLESSFTRGDPQAAYNGFLALSATCREMVVEAAQLRFKVNFGTPVCENCDGLKAGPGVVATCFQVRRCNYSNVKDTEITGRQLRVIDALGLHVSDSKGS